MLRVPRRGIDFPKTRSVSRHPNRLKTNSIKTMEKSPLQRSIELLQKANLEQAIEVLLEMRLSTAHRRVANAISRQFHRYKMDRLKGLLPVQDQQLLECQITDKLAELHEILLKAESPSLHAATSPDGVRSASSPWRIAFASVIGSRSPWKKWAVIMVDLIVLSAGILLAKNAELSSHRDATMHTPEAFSLRLPFHGVVMDSLMCPVQGIKVVLKRDPAQTVHTSKEGWFQLHADLARGSVHDTLELYRNHVCIYRQGIRFPGRDTLVVPGILESSLEPATTTPGNNSPTNERANGTIIQTGRIYCIKDAKDTTGTIVGIPNIRVAVMKTGRQSPIAEAWTDAQGNYALKVTRGTSPPDQILVDDPTGNFRTATEPFLPGRPHFDYELQKNEK
jgi:hypothetical protein